jgi:outer membrane autotransporter protein
VGAAAEAGSTSGRDGFERGAGAAQIGAGLRVMEDVRVFGAGEGDLWIGLAAGVGRITVDGDGVISASEADVDSIEAHLWGQYLEGPVDLRAWAGFGDVDVSAGRTTALGDRARAKYGARVFTLAAEARSWIDLDRTGRTFLQATPVLGFSLTRFERDGFTESNGGVENFRADAGSLTSLRSLVGFEGRWRPASAVLPAWLPAAEFSGRLGWEHEFGDASAGLSGSYVSDPSGTRFASDPAALSRDTLVAGLSLGVAVAADTTMRLSYDARMASGDLSHGLSLSVSLGF